MSKKTLFLVTLLCLVMLGIGVYLWHSQGDTGSVQYVPPPRTKMAGCVIQAGLPDQACTPGAVDVSATQEVVCNRKTSEVRDTSNTIEVATFRTYGVSRKDGVKRENDHLISLELGGMDNDIANHWPQYYEDEKKLESGLLSDDELGAHAKDKVENWLHQRVCKVGDLTLKEAQRMIATNWVAVYHQYLLRHRAQ